LPLRVTASLLAAAPPGLGQQAVARRLNATALRGRPPGSLARQRLAGAARVELDLCDRIQGECFISRRYAPAVAHFIARALPRRGGVFIDVGAHVGLMTFQVAASRPHGAVRIHAFEPNPASAERFRRNLELNRGADVTLVESAVGRGPGVAVLSSPAGPADLAADYVHVPAAGDSAKPSAGLEVPVVTLDDYADQKGLTFVDVIKLDVEGFEPFVLEGSSSLLADRRVGALVMEFNDVHLARVGSQRDDLIRSLAQQGYERVEIPPVGGQRIRRRRTVDGPVVDMAFAPRPLA
jgi:FkbM family methyltransferase